MDKPENPDLIALLRGADEQRILQRLEELDGEAAGLRTLLRAVRARQRVCNGKTRSPDDER